MPEHPMPSLRAVPITKTGAAGKNPAPQVAIAALVALSRLLTLIDFLPKQKSFVLSFPTRLKSAE